MKLFLDQNLSPDLVAQLTDLYPGSAHVYPLGLDRASDDAIWHTLGKRHLHGFTERIWKGHLDIKNGAAPHHRADPLIHPAAN